MIRQIALCTLLGCLTTTGVYAAGDAAAGQTKAATCAACHNADGNSVNPDWPKLAGQSPGYISKQLNDFKSGARQNATMAPMAAPLSEADIADLAAYFSAQKQQPGAASADLVAQGEAIYRAGDAETGVAACTACHGPTGAGNPAAKFPRVSGQHGKYLVGQLQAFKAGTRANDPNTMMRSIASRMSDAQMAAVADYMSGLH